MAEQTKEIANVGSGQLATVRELLFRNKAQFEMALPKHLSIDRLLRIALTAINNNPALLECHPSTLAGAVLTAAIWGLEPIGPGGCWLVPFRNTKKNRQDVQFIADYRGLIRIARNSGDVLRVEARSVFARDKFSYEYGTCPEISHVPYNGAESKGDLTHVYAVGFFREGSSQFVVLDIEAIKKARSSSKAAEFGPWKTHFEEMALKSAIRRLCKHLPMDPEKQRLVSEEEKGELQIPQDLGTLIDPTEVITQDSGNPETLTAPRKREEVVAGK